MCIVLSLHFLLVTVAWCGRWGCKLSQKLFVGKEYVLKHVRNKHTAVMEAKQQEVLLSASHCTL